MKDLEAKLKEVLKHFLPVWLKNIPIINSIYFRSIIKEKDFNRTG